MISYPHDVRHKTHPAHLMLTSLQLLLFSFYIFFSILKFNKNPDFGEWLQPMISQNFLKQVFVVADVVSQSVS